MAAYLSEILPRYNNGGATQFLMRESRDTAEGGGLALGQGFVGVETVSQADDLGLACAQDAAH